MDMYRTVLENSLVVEDDLMNEFRKAVLPVTIVIGVEIVLGLIGNSIVLYGYAFRYPRCTYRSLILCLAVVDVLSCCTTMPTEVFTEMFWFRFTFLRVCKAKSFFNVFALSIEILLLLTIAVDRYKQTCLPQSVQISPGLVGYIFTGSLLVAAGFAVPASVSFGHHTYEYNYNGVNLSVTTCGPTNEYTRGNFNLIYSICLQATACLSLVAMFIVYVFILKTICYRRRGGDRAPSELTGLIDYHQPDDGSDEELGTNRSLQMFLVSLVFILTTLACRIIGFIVSTHIQGFSINGMVIFVFFFRLYFINHVIHPFIYGLLDPKFRQEMKIVCSLRRRET